MVAQGVVSATVAETTRVLIPAGTAVVTTFGFPLGLALAVAIFLIIQNRLDNEDPKLRSAPLTEAETLLPFEPEDEQ